MLSSLGLRWLLKWPWVKLDIDRVVFLFDVENQLFVGLRAFRVAVFYLPHVGSGGCCGQLGSYQNASRIIT